MNYVSHAASRRAPFQHCRCSSNIFNCYVIYKRSSDSSGGSKAACPVVAASTAAVTDEVDVAVIGAGIIGLCVIKKLLEDTQLSVALLDQKAPCAGATGAGQGYIWMAHREPSSAGWALARHSKAAWEKLAAAAAAAALPSSSNRLQQQQQQLATSLEFQASGSLLLATTEEEVHQLQQRAIMLQQQGIQGVGLLSGRELKMLEPAVQLPPGGQGLLVKSDAQINGQRTAWAMLEYCCQLARCTSSRGSGSRLLLGLNEPVVSLEPAADSSSSSSGSSSSSNAAGVDVITTRRRVHARHGVVVAAGVWSGPLLAAATGEARWQQLLQPRRGHLLEVTPPAGMPKVHKGMMELSYTRHYSDSAGSSSRSSGSSIQQQQQQQLPAAADVDITFTATTSLSGKLLIGSSREFCGWEVQPSSSIVSAIMQRASAFLPALAAVPHQQQLSSTRVGLRPFAFGLPAVGPVPGLPGVTVAAGHEGSGLTQGPATADLVVHQLLGLEDGINRELLAAAQQLQPKLRLGRQV